MLKNRAEKIAKMKMPMKPMAENEADMDMEGLDIPAEAAEEGEPVEQEQMENDMGEAAEDNGLADLSDDELIKELATRGLTGKHLDLQLKKMGNDKNKMADEDSESDEI